MDESEYVYVSLKGGAGARYPFPSMEAAVQFAVKNRNANYPAVVFDSNGVVIHCYLRKRG